MTGTAEYTIFEQEMNVEQATEIATFPTRKDAENALTALEAVRQEAEDRLEKAEKRFKELLLDAGLTPETYLYSPQRAELREIAYKEECYFEDHAVGYCSGPLWIEEDGPVPGPDPRTFWNAIETLAQLGEGGLAEDLAKLGEAEEINQALSQVASSRGVTGGLRAAQGAAEQAVTDAEG